MDIRQLTLSNKDRKRLLELVQEAAEELDQVSSDIELERMEEELANQLKDLLARDDVAAGFGKKNPGISRFDKKRGRIVWAGSSLSLAAVVMLSLFGLQSPPEEEAGTMLAKGQAPDMPCSIKFIQACNSQQSSLYVQSLSDSKISLIADQNVFIAVSCPYTAPLTLSGPALKAHLRELITDPAGSKMSLLTKDGQNIQLEPSQAELQISFEKHSINIQFDTTTESPPACDE